MGNKSTKSSLRNAIVFLNISADPIAANDDKFWAQIFSEEAALADEVIKNITVQEVRILRDGSPKNFATLAYKMVERLCLATGTLCNTQSQQTAVLNAIRILIRMLPCCFEDRAWRHFFANNQLEQANELRANPRLSYAEKGADERDYAAYLPLSFGGSRSVTPTAAEPKSRPGAASSTGSTRHNDDEVDLLLAEQETCEAGKDKLQACGSKLDACCSLPQAAAAAAAAAAPSSSGKSASNKPEGSLMKSLVLSICDLLFCPEFTVLPHGVGYLANAVDTPPEDLKSLSTYDYVWEPGVGFESSVNSTTYYDKNRTELLRALLVCLSATLYESPQSSIKRRNEWIEIFVSQENRHALPMFTSLLNVVFGHKPSRVLLQFNSLLVVEGGREQLVSLSAQLLSAVLDYATAIDAEADSIRDPSPDEGEAAAAAAAEAEIKKLRKNLFIDYMSRIHRNEDFVFLMRGFIRLMNEPLAQAHVWSGASKCLELDLELQLLFWRICNLNRKFMQFFLASSEVQGLVVPILHHLNENFREPSRTALIHIGVFNLLILSGERNFGVRLNRPYTSNTLDNLPDFTGSHADLMIIVFHKLIMYGYKINQLYDYLLTILVNVSPYLKGTTILASKCLMQLFETFTSPMVVFTEPAYHQLVVFLLEFFNNIIQYQFDGNSNLIHVILTKRELFTNLANLSTSQSSIDKVLRKLMKHKECIEQANEPATKTKPKSTTSEPADANEETKLESGGPTTSTECEPENNFAADFDLEELATVSCSNTGPDWEHNTRKREVALVATPDLSNITSPIFPFGRDNGVKKAAKLARDEQRPKSEERAMFNFDDIMTSDSCDLGLISRVADETLAGAARTTEVSAPAPGAATEDRRGRGITSETAGEAQPAAPTANVARCERWRPTSEWLKQWKQTLPLETSLRMISALDPQLEQLKRSSGRPLDENEMIKFLQSGTLVGLLPVPHPIQIRKYRTSSSSTMWFRACSWGIIYARTATIWSGTDIKLIKMRCRE